MSTPITPYQDSKAGKKEQVASMFDSIAHKYDFLNHFLSLGIDFYWRKKAIDKLVDVKPKKLLDIATGTGDFAIEALRLKPEQIVGVDISKEMLEVGKKKIKKLKKEDIVELKYGDSEDLPFEDNSFDAATAAFGVRNFENLEKGLIEINRVLKPNGKIVILEFSRPRIFPLKQLYNFYFHYILPTVGKMFSGDNSAYTYLPESVQAFPDGESFLEILNKCGFHSLEERRLTLGICSIYCARK